jgi:transposase InsO family protein
VGGPLAHRGCGGVGGSVVAAAVVSASGAGAGKAGGDRDAAGASPRWSAKRIRPELLRRGLPWRPHGRLAQAQLPSSSTIDRILRHHGLVKARQWMRPRDSYLRFERPGPMQLWGIDIVGGIQLVNAATGEWREAKIVTSVDDPTRCCVMAAVVERATARAVCLAFAQALARHGCRRR